MKNVMLLSGLLLLTSCVSLDGNLIVKEKMTLIKKGGFLNLQRKEVDIEANQYKASLKVLSENNYTLELDKGSDTIKIPLKSKTDLKLPTHTGTFTIKHNDIDQPFDITGHLVTDVQDSPEVNSIENCTWTTHERRCHNVCHEEERDHDRRRDGRDHRLVSNSYKCEYVCRDESVTHYGRQEVVSFSRRTSKEIDLDFLSVKNGAILAHFNGENIDFDRIVSSRGICR